MVADVPFQERHNAKAKEALNLLRKLASQATTTNSIKSSLESFNWIELPPSSTNTTTTTNLGKGLVKMFILKTIEGTMNSTSEGLTGGGEMRRGVRSNESLFLRGEGFIEGQWNCEDVVATIRSFGARAVSLSLSLTLCEILLKI